ncbi:hypothetical protein KO361_04595 [Candidatus Woesearchaeota archaeon]|nr:hypothetical protein [Candidatus Woesearchaeota archaeon]
MKKIENTHLLILYIVVTISILLSATTLTGFATKNKDTEMEWICNYAECTNYVEISGEEWARENCQITAEGTICLLVMDDGRQFQVPLEELNLNEITATKCTSYVCVQETPIKKVNYEINIEDYLNN